MRIYNYIEHDTELVDSFPIRCFTVGDPLVAPGEDSNAPVNTFKSGCLFTVEHSIGSDSSDCPDAPGKREAPEQYCETKRY